MPRAMTIPSLLSVLLRALRLYISPVRVNEVLPCEVLALVFNFLELEDLLLASQVCAFWRDAAVGTPRLWAKFYDPQLAALPTLTARARAVPISLDVSCATPTDLARVRDCIADHHIQLNALVIHLHNSVSDYSSSDWDLLSAALRHVVPRLESLALVSAVNDAVVTLPADVFPDCAPRLRRLKLGGFALTARVRAGTTHDLPLDAQFPALENLMLLDAGVRPLPPLSPAHRLRALTIFFVGGGYEDADAWLRAAGVQRIHYLEVYHTSLDVQGFALQAVPRDCALRRITIEHSPDGALYLSLGYDGDLSRVVIEPSLADARTHLHACGRGATTLRCSTTSMARELVAELSAEVRAGLVELEPVFTPAIVPAWSKSAYAIDGKPALEFATGVACNVKTIKVLAIPALEACNMQGSLGTSSIPLVRSLVPRVVRRTGCRKIAVQLSS